MPNPQWLTPREMRAWLAYVDCSTLLSDYLDQQLRHDAGLTHPDYMLLAYLSAAPEHRLSMTALAERLKFTRSRLTRAVSRLEDAGWVRRQSDPSDGRGQLAVLTDAGFALLRENAPGHVEAVRRAVFDALTPDQVDQLAAIGEAIARSVERAHRDCAHPAALPWNRR